MNITPEERARLRMHCDVWSKCRGTRVVYADPTELLALLDIADAHDRQAAEIERLTRAHQFAERYRQDFIRYYKLNGDPHWADIAVIVSDKFERQAARIAELEVLLQDCADHCPCNEPQENTSRVKCHLCKRLDAALAGRKG